jgi:hypothetical protein
MTTVFDHSHGSLIGQEENKATDAMDTPTPRCPGTPQGQPKLIYIELMYYCRYSTTATILLLLLLPRRSAPLIQRISGRDRIRGDRRRKVWHR